MATGVLLAAGTSSRFGDSVPKQLTKLAGQTLLEHSLATFNEHPNINEIVIVTQENLIPIIRDISKNSFNKVSDIIQGGKSRYQSSLAAIKHIVGDKDTKILLHDAARPFVTSEMITGCIKALKKYKAVTVAIPSSDTLLDTVDDVVVSIPNRKDFMRAQTPQGFRLGVIREAYEFLEKKNNFVPTDDCGVVNRYLPNIKIGVINGSDTNIKVTYPKDIHLAEALLKHSSD